MKNLKKLVALILFCNFIGDGFAQEGVKAKINKTIEVTYEVRKINVVNTSWSEFSPTISGTKLVYVSDRNLDYLNIGENRWKKKKYVSLFESNITIPAQDTVIFSEPKLIKDPFSSINHSGPVCYTKDGSEAILSQDLKEYGHVNKPQLYLVKKENEKWGDKIILPFVKEEYIYSHPALSDDGTTLYFVSDMPGGKGGKDIFYSVRTGENWSDPIALGDEVNSDKDELFPFFRNNVLYFSTDGRNSIGGLDLFKAEVSASGKWKEAVSLGNTINSIQDDFGFTLDQESRTGFFSSNREGGKGADDIYYFKIIETVTMISQDIEGKFNYKKLESGVPGNMEVMLYDEAGNFIGKVTTDKDGYFRFQNLPLDKGFIIKTAENGNELFLTIIGEEGNPAAFLLSDNSGAFIYKKLDVGYTGSLALMEVEDTEMGKSGKISGQFKYDKLALGQAKDLNVYLVDDEGKIVFKTKTDSYGNFEFKSLPLESNYIIKTDANNDGMILFVYNKENEVIAQMRMNENGEFTYRKLDPSFAHIALMESNDTEKLAPKSNNIGGNFYYTKLEGKPSNLAFEIYDDQGNLIHKGVADEKGDFFVSNLPISENYLFKIAADDPNFNKDIELNINNRTNVSIAKLVKNEKGEFVFKKLELGETSITSIDNSDFSLSVKPSTIYFDLNSSHLSSDYKLELDKVAENLKKDEKVKIIINAHADSRADEKYNLWLSERRANAIKNYLASKGISNSRMSIKSFGESQLINKCDDSVDCSDEEHKANRRAEISYQK